jgi:hypothetical protein
MSKKKPLEIDMCAGTQARDSQGELLDIEGADISGLIGGFFNDNHSPSFINRIGRVTGAKKIFKEEDCEDDRQKHYWHQVKTPYLYVKGVLYDNEDHVNARAAAAILRSIYKTDAPLKMKASVEGATVARGIKDPTILARTKIRGIALTFTPANQATLVEPLSLSKTETTAADELLIKSVLHLAQDNVPSFIDISKRISEETIVNNIKYIAELVKGLSAGGGGGAPGTLTGGQVIQKETFAEPVERYITCDSCGHDQIFTKYQTKCRECGKAFPFAKLVKFFSNK